METFDGVSSPVMKLFRPSEQWMGLFQSRNHYSAVEVYGECNVHLEDSIGGMVREQLQIFALLPVSVL